MNRNKTLVAFIAAVVVIGGGAWRAYSHCQIPCGIYDDDARLAAIREHIQTIEKSMNSIIELSAQDKPNQNQLVRWVNNKDHHADLIARIVTQYFMAQRLKPVAEIDTEDHRLYVRKLTILHRMLVASMKAKQTTDLKYAEQLTELLHEFIHAGPTKTAAR